jgi:hypothetical protein
MKHEDDAFDVEKLRLRPEDAKDFTGKVTPRPARRRTDFTIIPRAWSDRLDAARHTSTFKIALRLLHQHWKNGGQPIKLTNVALTNAGVSRRQKWRGLPELKQLGLIKIERRRRKSPLVTLLKI